MLQRAIQNCEKKYEPHVCQPPPPTNITESSDLPAHVLFTHSIQQKNELDITINLQRALVLMLGLANCCLCAAMHHMEGANATSLQLFLHHLIDNSRCLTTLLPSPYKVLWEQKLCSGHNIHSFGIKIYLKTLKDVFVIFFSTIL